MYGKVKLGEEISVKKEVDVLVVEGAAAGMSWGACCK